jgi:hypothetical protein
MKAGLSHCTEQEDTEERGRKARAHFITEQAKSEAYARCARREVTTEVRVDGGEGVGELSEGYAQRADYE